jgi:hypothetical protein
MKKRNLIPLSLLCCLQLSCQPKTEQTPPIIDNNTINHQNYKFDDDEILKRKAEDSIKNKIAPRKTQKTKQ